MACFIALNEVYYGKTPNLQRAEKLMADIKKQYDGMYTEGLRVANDRRWREISDLLAREFGLERIYLDLYSGTMMNMMTPPITFSIECMPAYRLRKNFLIDQKGMRFKESAKYVLHIMAFAGLVLNPIFTAAEIIGVILHEIGHNFQAVVDDTSFYLQDFTYFTRLAVDLFRMVLSGGGDNAPSIILQYATLPLKYSQTLLKLDKKVQEYLMTQKWFIKPWAMFEHITTGLTEVKNNIYYLMTALLGFISIYPITYSAILNGILETLGNPLGYRSEMFSDNFATIYGYGPELSSALLKLETNKSNNFKVQTEVFDKVPLLKQFTRLSYDCVSYITSMYDVHPNSMARCYDQIKYLEKEIESNKHLTRDSKAHLMKQVKEIDKNIDQVINHPDLDNHWGYFSYSMAQSFYLSKGESIRGSMNKDLHSSIQRTYDRAVKKMR